MLNYWSGYHDQNIYRSVYYWIYFYILPITTGSIHSTGDIMSTTLDKILAAVLLAGLLMWGMPTRAAGNNVDWYQIGADLTIVADWAQTRHIAANPGKYYETNPILGRHPSAAQVNQYFVSVLVLNHLAKEVLPPKVSKYFYMGVATIQTTHVLRNYRIGIRMEF